MRNPFRSPPAAPPTAQGTPLSPDILGIAPRGHPGTARLGRRVTWVLGALGVVLVVLVMLGLERRQARLESGRLKAALPKAEDAQPAKPNATLLEASAGRIGVVPEAPPIILAEAADRGVDEPRADRSANSGRDAIAGSQVTPSHYAVATTGVRAGAADGAYADQWRDYYATQAALRRAAYDRQLESIKTSSQVGGSRANTGQSPTAAAAVAPGSSLAQLLRASSDQAALPPLGVTSNGGQPQGQTQPSLGRSGSPVAAGWTGRDDSSTLLAASVQPSHGRTELKAGTVINAVLLSAIQSDLPGLIQGQVTRGVYDTVSGVNLLIPPGARLIGRYNDQVGYGQGRVQVAWNRLIFPDGISLNLDAMAGSDAAGRAGFADEVDNHYRRLFGSALAVSAFGAAAQLSQPAPAVAGVYNPGQTAASALGQQVAQLGNEVTRKNLQVQPTIRIREGYPFTVILTKDVVLPTWRGDQP